MIDYKKKLIIFDLDGTLAESKSPMDVEMSKLLGKLLAKKKVAVISGGSFEQFQKQFLAGLQCDKRLFSNLSLCPTCGASMYIYKEDMWQNVYREELSENEKKRTFEAFYTAFLQAGFFVPETIYGDLIEDRFTQVTFSAYGQKAPLELKSGWDPDQSKRKKIVSFMEKLLPDLEVRIGGSTSIDVTKKGIDKAFGVRKLSDILHIPIKDILFVGDALFPGGNDYSATVTGVDTFAVSGVKDTKKLIQSLVRV